MWTVWCLGLGAPLVFFLLRSSVTYLRGGRSHCDSPVTIGALDLVIAEGHLIEFTFT